MNSTERRIGKIPTETANPVGSVARADRYFRKHPSLFTAGVALVVFLVWYFANEDPFSYFRDHWQVSLTMLFGSWIAGSTSEGGGAIAFPVFTKVLEISPMDAKIFSLAIQSVGMGAASLTIIVARIPVEWRAIFWASLGGVPGIVFGSMVLAPALPPPLVKLSFTAMATSFAVVLFILNRTTDEDRFSRIQSATMAHCRALCAAGFLGGIMSGLVGNGIDLIVFSVLVLRFRLSEKVATPTSVVLMAGNAMVGFALHGLVLGEFSQEIRSWWLAAVPVVVVGAPLGALFCSRLDRKLIANMLIGLILVELVTSLWLIPITPTVGSTAFTAFVLFSTAFFALYRLGLKTTTVAVYSDGGDRSVRAGRG